MSDTQQRIDQLVKSNNILLFMKGSASFPMCGFSGRAIQILKACGVETKDISTVNVPEDQGIQQLAHDPPALRAGRVHRRLGHHDGDVRIRRVAAAAGTQGLSSQACDSRAATRLRPLLRRIKPPLGGFFSPVPDCQRTARACHKARGM